MGVGSTRHSIRMSSPQRNMETRNTVAACTTTTRQSYSSSSVAVAASLFVVAAAALLFFIRFSYRRAQYHGKKLPPGPPGLPLIGHLHLLAGMPTHRAFSRLSKKYGPVLMIRFGSTPAVVLNSPSMAREFFFIHDHHFLDRPNTAFARTFYQSRSLFFQQYGNSWRELRKTYTLHILSSNKIGMYRHIRQEEVSSALREIELQSPKGGVPVEMNKFLFTLVGNVMSRTLFSKRAFGSSFEEATEFREIVLAMSVLSGAIVVDDFVPIYHLFGGHKRRLASVFKRLDAFLDQVLRERVLERQKLSEESVPKDFLDSLLNIYKGRLDETGKESIKCALGDLLSGGVETSATTVEWAMTELLRHPCMMKKLQQELDNAQLGGKTHVEESAIPTLRYLEAVVKETFRFHPPIPLIIHQMSTPAGEVGEVAGYYIPDKTISLVNVWAIGRDPVVWENPEEFMPERFLGSCSDIDVRSNHFKLLNFGVGRRGCPAINLGLTTVGLILANLVNRFDWSLPEGESPETLDLTEKPGLSAPKAKPLLAVPKPRSLPSI